ncbi:MAG: haloalkane dehalogenase [Promethearchaeota archaeon]
MPIIRTPEERFKDLDEFPYNSQYLEVDSLRVHYVDEGKGESILCLHGEPTWSYLYRKMIPLLSENHRVLAFDFFGFGRSDKFTRLEEYTFELHANQLIQFIKKLKLTQITLVVQDWGGMIGLSVAGKFPEWFSRLVIMNTGLPSGRRANEAFLAWREFVETTPDLPIGQIITMGTVNENLLTPEIIKAYEAPFPDSSYKAGARAWPLLVPIRPNDPVAAINLQTRENLQKWEKPALVMFSDGDPITMGADVFFRNLIPGSKDQPEIVINDAGHFLQEEKGEEIAKNISDFISRT